MHCSLRRVSSCEPESKSEIRNNSPAAGLEPKFPFRTSLQRSEMPAGFPGPPCARPPVGVWRCYCGELKIPCPTPRPGHPSSPAARDVREARSSGAEGKPAGLAAPQITYSQPGARVPVGKHQPRASRGNPSCSLPAQQGRACTDLRGLAGNGLQTSRTLAFPGSHPLPLTRGQRDAPRAFQQRLQSLPRLLGTAGLCTANGTVRGHRGSLSLC